MASGHHLLVVTFALCGLLFLLHVDSVNSSLLRCKKCPFNDPPSCGPENTTDTWCNLNQRCATYVWTFADGHKAVAYRNCAGTHVFCTGRDPDYVKIERVYYCDTDFCNNQQDSDFANEIISAVQCPPY